MKKKVFLLMKKDIMDYLAGKRNVVKDEFVVSREKARDSELIYISHPKIEKPVYTFWHSRKQNGKSVTPKHTGGKKPYVILMIDEIVKLMDSGLPAEYAGYLLYLTPYIEWGTGRLVCGRKKRKMKHADLQKVFSRRRQEMLHILAGLKNHNLLTYTKEGYFISRDIVKRGGKNALKV
jgi:hypothetical protein